MQRQKLKTVSVVFSLVAAFIFAAAWGITAAWSEYKNEKKYHRALALYASTDATERRLSLALLAQVQGKENVIRLIGERLYDVDLANQLFAIHCLQVLVGDSVSLPAGAEIHTVSVVTRPQTASDRRDQQVKFTDEAMDTYILRWQEWFRSAFLANSSNQDVIITTKVSKLVTAVSDR